jgi:hypothetical protein
MDVVLAVAKHLVANWFNRTGGYENTGFRIVIHVDPGQTKARIEWPPPIEHIKTK